MKSFMKNTLFEINNAIRNGKAEFVKECESSYRSAVNQIAELIADDDDLIIIAVAGPSSSGKTTTAKLLRSRLERLDENTEVVSLDDFYLEYENLPDLPDGSKDLESVNALDLDLIKKCFNEIINCGKSELPIFNFKMHSRETRKRIVDIKERGIIIVEGLHALNPLITSLVPEKNLYKIYVSTNDSVYTENGDKLLESWDIRLIRRVLRDEKFRGSNIGETLELWDNVIDGEKKHLYRYKKTADYKLTTLHPYELGLYKEKFLKLAKKVKKTDPHFELIKKVCDALIMFDTVEEDLVPSDSLLREFIG